MTHKKKLHRQSEALIDPPISPKLSAVSTLARRIPFPQCRQGKCVLKTGFAMNVSQNRTKVAQNSLDGCTHDGYPKNIHKWSSWILVYQQSTVEFEGSVQTTGHGGNCLLYLNTTWIMPYLWLKFQADHISTNCLHFNHREVTSKAEHI